MIRRLYSVRDSLSRFFDPRVELNDAVALRNFTASVLDDSPGNLLNSCPADYSLFYVGAFDDDTGVLIPEPVPVLIANASSVLIKEVS